MGKYDKIVIYWDKKDRIYIAEVPELPGCAAHGKNYDEALRNAKKAIQLWLDTAEEFNDPIPEPKGSKLMYA
jgi:predicted RNase H-like HicB family nuclease